MLSNTEFAGERPETLEEFSINETNLSSCLGTSRYSFVNFK